MPKKSRKSVQNEVDLFPSFSISNDELDKIRTETYEPTLPLLPLKNMVLFPGVVLPVTIGREKSMKAVSFSGKTSQNIAVVAQRDTNVEEPGFDDLYTVGVVAKILKVIDMPDGTMTAILQGRRRFSLKDIVSNEPYISVTIEPLDEIETVDREQFAVKSATMKDFAKKIVELSPLIPNDAANMLQGITNPQFLMHFIASNLNVDNFEKQNILEADDLDLRADLTLQCMANEIKVLELKGEIEEKVRDDMEKQQREYILNQQLKTIQDELGDNSQQEDIDELKKKAESKNWPQHAKDKFERELKKLQRMNPMVPEYSITVNYLELLTDLPWETYTEDNFDLDLAEQILSSEHYGLDKVKDRILEYLAVLKLRNDMKAPILCLIGPPGVGKTSLGKSIAKALGRHYIRMSLGGLHDEAELRGHRKTYIGAMPGRILQSVKKAAASRG